LLIGLLEDNSIDLNIAIGRAKSYLFFALLVVIIDEKIDLEEFAPLTGVVAVIMEVVFVVYLFSPHTFAELYQYTIEKDNMFISTRRDVGFGMFYYKTSATIVFVLALCFQRVEDGRHRMQNLLLACGCSFALLLSGARANLMGGFLICMCYCFRWLRRKVGYLAAYSVVTVVVVVSLSYVVNSWSSGSGNKESNDIKYAHLISYSNIFMDRPSLLLMGEGLGSAFRTKAAPNDSHVYDAELAYIEIVRELGLPMALVVIGAFIMPLYLIKKRGLLAARRNMVVAYTAYLLMAWSNPLLISSTGIMVLLCMYSVAYVQKGRDRFRPVLVARGVGV
jgi:hypothetical protein